MQVYHFLFLQCVFTVPFLCCGMLRHTNADHGVTVAYSMRYSTMCRRLHSTTQGQSGLCHEVCVRALGGSYDNKILP